MIKINLLPPHVVERRKVRSLAILLVAVLLLEVGGLFFYYSTLVQTEKSRKAQLAQVKIEADNVRNLEATAQAEINSAGKVFKDIAWYDNIYKHNAKIADTLSKINEYIYSKMTVRTLQLSGTQVSIQGTTKDLDHIAAAYLNMLRSPYITPARGVSFTPSIGGGGSTTGRIASGAGPQRRTPGGAPAIISGGPAGRSLPTTTQANVPATGRNPNEMVSVAFKFTLKPEYSIGGAKTGGTTSGQNAGATPGGAVPSAALEGRSGK